MDSRNHQIILTSCVGISANVLLAAFKALVGALAGSIAIIMDAVNNLSDAVSSLITIIGARLSAQPADRTHPFGHGRVEYFSAIVISLIVLMTGLGSLVESVRKLLHPTQPDYTALTLTVIIVAIIVKLVLGRYVKLTGKRLKSDALIASGSDALFDAIITLSTLLSAAIMLLWGVSIDGILGTIISLVIIKSGADMLRSPINALLGSRVSCQLVKEVKKEVMSFDGVHGVFDVIMNTYGPSSIIGSMHVSVLDTMMAPEIHSLERRIAERLYKRFGIIATIGIYAINTGNTRVARMQRDVLKRASAVPGIISAHAFYVDSDSHVVTLDIMPEYNQDGAKLKAELMQDLKAAYPEYSFDIIVDNNYSED